MKVVVYSKNSEAFVKFYSYVESVATTNGLSLRLTYKDYSEENANLLKGNFLYDSPYKSETIDLKKFYVSITD